MDYPVFSPGFFLRSSGGVGQALGQKRERKAAERGRKKETRRRNGMGKE